MRYNYVRQNKEFWMTSLRSLEKAINLSPEKKLFEFDPEDAELIAVLYIEWSFLHVFNIYNTFLLYFKPIELNIEDDWYKPGDSFFYRFFNFEDVTGIIDDIIIKFIDKETINQHFGRWWSHLPLWMMLKIDYFHLCYKHRLQMIAEELSETIDANIHLNKNEHWIIDKWLHN